MATKKCLIAGLPASGKSTYIGALWYNLRTNEDMRMKSGDDLPNDIETLTLLSDLWKMGTQIDRTNSNATDRVSINLEEKESGDKFLVEVPDFLGETFRDILDLKEDAKIKEWCDGSDVLFYFIDDLNPGEFEDDDEHDDSEKQEEEVPLPTLTSSNMASDAQNMMIIKYLLSLKNFEKVAIIISKWDKYTNNGKKPLNPESYLKQTSPALYNFLRHHINNCLIIGLSAQGTSYLDNDADKDLINTFKKELMQSTLSGKRAFVQVKDSIEYDLSLPLQLLLD